MTSDGFSADTQALSQRQVQLSQHHSSIISKFKKNWVIPSQTAPPAAPEEAKLQNI